MTAAPANAPMADPLELGRWTVIPLRDGQWRQNPADMWLRQEAAGIRVTGLGRAQADWDRYPELLHRDGTLELTIGGYLVVGLGKVILVDAGQGPEPLGPLVGGELPGSLAKAGYAAADVTDVLFTHLHSDHTGWASRDGRPYFPAATYWCHSAEIPFATGHGRLGAVASLVERMETFDGDRGIAPGVDVKPSPGHTPGSSSVVVSSGRQTVMLIGDAAHCVHELLEPDWNGMADDDPALARQTRQAIAEELESSGAYAGGGHFPGLAFGRMLSRERRHWTFARD
jgi:glyoxylase-like metal-dependent hydrolase (beta-lactamase superfamily II)